MLRKRKADWGVCFLLMRASSNGRLEVFLLRISRQELLHCVKSMWRVPTDSCPRVAARHSVTANGEVPPPPAPIALDTPEHRRTFYMRLIFQSDILLRRIVLFLYVRCCISVAQLCVEIHRSTAIRVRHTRNGPTKGLLSRGEREKRKRRTA